MKAIQNAVQAATALLSVEAKYEEVVAYYAERGVLKDDTDMTPEEKTAKKECKEAIYQALSKREGGIAAKAAKLPADGWKDLTGREKEKYQAERDRVKLMVDNRWSRLKKAASTAEEEAKAKEAAKAGEAAPAKVYADQIQIWTDYEVRSTKANKRRPAVDPQWFADLQKRYRAELEAHIAEQK